VRVVSGWYEGDWMDEPFEYETRGKPCALVVERSLVAFPDALTTRFPEAKPAIDMGLESYLAICLRGRWHTPRPPGRDGRGTNGGRGRRCRRNADLRLARRGRARASPPGHRIATLSRARDRGADSERRRVGRDLHDGAQQRLVAVANLLKLAQRRLGDGDEAIDVLRLAGDELSTAQTELRDLARGLHPVALSERGLHSALESLTVACEIPVTLDVAVDELPDDVELAAYFIVSESLTNARKYADAEAVQVRVARVADALLVEIVDDGSGGADPAAGTGLRGLADRVDALGGRLEVESPPGAGTRVSARLPLPPLG
jgi:signal transduction histidine kinase